MAIKEAGAGGKGVNSVQGHSVQYGHMSTFGLMQQVGGEPGAGAPECEGRGGAAGRVEFTLTA